MPDWLRLGVGTLTRLPVPAPRDTGRRTAGRAISSAPIIGVVLALVCGLPLLLPVDGPAQSFVAAVLVIALLAWTTRGLHLDGLADTADALGSAKPGPEALEIARRSDIGPFGVVVLLLAVLLQVGSLTACALKGEGFEAIIMAVAASRVALTWACARGIPPARPDGLGAAVASTVPRTVVALWAVAVVGSAYAVLGPEGAGGVAFGLSSGFVMLRIARRRFNGVTGDVLGAVIEIALTGTLVALALSP